MPDQNPPTKLLPAVTADNYAKLLDLALQSVRNAGTFFTLISDLETHISRLEQKVDAMSDLSKAVLSGLSAVQDSVNALAARLPAEGNPTTDTADTVNDLTAAQPILASIKSQLDALAALPTSPPSTPPAPSGITISPAPSTPGAPSASAPTPQTSAEGLVSN